MLSRRALLGLLASTPLAAPARPMRSNDRLTVVPTLAHRGEDGALRLRIDAWVFERERNPTRTRLLARLLDIDWDDLSLPERRRFSERTALFGTDAKDGREFALHRFGQAPLALPPSDREGRVRAEVAHGRAVDAGQWIDWQLASGLRRFGGRSLWPGDEGLSVVCDIDDTIKHTQVRQRREMLLNTFARDFVAVPGMAQALRHAAPGAAFHYVSGGPRQLLPPLADFLRTQRFPDGSVHLRTFSLAPWALLDAQATARHKHAEIAQLLRDHPRRRFVLVGDSGEHDPEIYGQIAREHGPRIDAVAIRDASGEAADAARYTQAFAGVARQRWSLFTDPAALAQTLTAAAAPGGVAPTGTTPAR